MKHFIPFGKRLIVAVAALTLSVCAHAQTNFTRIAGGNWTTAAGWSPLGVPGAADSASIGAFDVSLDTSATVSNLTLNLGANTFSSDGTRVLTVLRTGSWSGGAISNMKLKLDPACTFTFGGGNKNLFTSSFTNAGTINWTSGQLNLENNTTFHNQPGAIFDVQFDGTMIQNGGGTSTFRNDGMYRKSAGANTNNIQIVSFINTGTASVSNGVIRFGTTTVTASGAGNTFFAESGASMVFNQANSFANSSFSGPGFKYLASGVGVANVSGNLNATNLVFTAGTWQGNATLHGGLEWTGGTLSPELTIASGSTLKLSGSEAKSLVNSGVITNHGSVVWTGGQFNLDNNVSFYNQPGALFDVQFDGLMIQNVGGTSTFRNAGTYRKSGGAGTNTINIVSFIQSAALEINVGVIRVIGNYAPGAGSSLKTLIGGTTAGAQFGQLQVSGVATLTGPLHLGLTNSFVPATNHTFQILSAASRSGVFGGTTGSSLGGGLYLTPAYLANGVRLDVVDGMATFGSPKVLAGQFQFQLAGTVGGKYQIEASTNLLNWTAIATNQVPGSGLTNFVDADSAFFPRRFYRALFLP
jgi:fibronectin-binding autotransporter adhesin